MATRIVTNTSPSDFLEEWERYFSYLTSVLNKCRWHREKDSVEKVRYFWITLERFIVSTNHLYDDVSVSDCLMLAELLEWLVHSLRDSLVYWCSHDVQFQSTAANVHIPHAGELYRCLEFEHTGACVCYIFIYMCNILHCTWTYIVSVIMCMWHLYFYRQVG